MIQNIRRSLTDLLGAEYTAAVCRARAALTGESPEALRAVADEKVDFYPEAFAREIQAAVLADAECAQPAQRSCKAVLGGAV